MPASFYLPNRKGLAVFRRELPVVAEVSFERASWWSRIEAEKPDPPVGPGRRSTWSECRLKKINNY